MADLIKHLIFSYFVVLNELQSAHPLLSPFAEKKNLKSVGKDGDSLFPTLKVGQQSRKGN